MLQASITVSDNETKVFKEEFTQFTWSTVNSEAITFSASVPPLSASFVLLTTDSFANRIAKGDTVIVTSDGDASAQIILTVNESTVLFLKGVTEVSCTGEFFSLSNSTFGILDIPEASDFSQTQQKFGLQNVEMHEGNGHTVLNVETKTDIIAGIAWSLPTRRSVSRTPFATADGNFSQKGVGIFKPTKPSEQDTYAPVYSVNAEDIISYEVSPPQPPVTYIRTRGLGRFKAQPQMRAAVAGLDEDYFDTSRVGASFVVQGVTAAQAVFQRDSQGVVQSTLLQWDDGTENIVTGARVIGIFSNAYITVSSSDVISIVNKLTGVATNMSLEGSYAAYEAALSTRNSREGEPYYTQKLKRDEYDVDTEVYWFRVPVANKTVAIQRFVASETIEFRTLAYTSMPEGVVFAGDDQRSEFLTTSVTFYAIGLYVDPELENFRVVSISHTGGSGAYVPSVRGLVKPGDEFTVDNKTWYCVSAHIVGFRRRAQYITVFEAIYANVGSEYKYFIKHEASNKYVSDVQVAGRYSESSEGFTQWVGVVPEKDFYSFVDFYSGGTVRDIFSGSIAEWLFVPYEKVVFGASSGLLTYYVYTSDRSVIVASQFGPTNPFQQHGAGDFEYRLDITPGQPNPVDLGFRIGTIAQTDSAQWDTETGRIEISLSQFYVRNNSTGQWVSRSVQDLWVMAMTSYCRVYLTPEQQESGTPILMKVTGFSLSYSGVVTAKLTGIVVE